jgi:hypothetical protein
MGVEDKELRIRATERGGIGRWTSYKEVLHNFALHKIILK